MNKKQKKAYLKDPNFCPECNSKNITAGDYDFDGKRVYSEIKCEDCGAEWGDIYTLTNVELKK